MSGIVTGEAVVVPLDVARPPSRAIAFAVDALIQLAVAVGGVWALTTVLDRLDRAALAAVTLTAVVAVLVGLPVLWETLTRGRSPGKALMGLRVVRDDGGAIRFRHALVRALVGVFVDLWVSAGLVALISSSVSSHGKRVGDLLAGTLVVRERIRLPPAPTPAMPPALAPWAATLDLTGLGDDLAATVRIFLARTGELAPSVRAATGVNLAQTVAGRVSPAPPMGVPPETYLAAVVAERHRREVERARQSAQAAQAARAQTAPFTDGAPGPARTPPGSVTPPPVSPTPVPPGGHVPPGGFTPPR
jgi:uncharacterized RDD family membrane protein YckC